MTAPCWSPVKNPDLASHPPHRHPAQRIPVGTDEREQQMTNTSVPIHFKSQADVAKEIAAAWQALTLGEQDQPSLTAHQPTMAGIALLRKLRVMRMALPYIMATGVLPKDGDAPGKSGGRKPPFRTSLGPVRNCRDQWRKRGA